MFGLLTLLSLTILVTLSQSSIQFTNMKCTDFDTEFAMFANCRINMVQRGVSALSVYVKLFQTPVNNVTVNVSLHKKLNGYRPFLYNYTMDFCKFLNNPKKNLFLKLVMEVFMESSNINHTCPYDHDIILDKLVLNEDRFKRLPLPHGDYMLQFKVGAYNDWKADVKIYMQFRLSFVD